MFCWDIFMPFLTHFGPVSHFYKIFSVSNSSAFKTKLLFNFIEITLRHGCSPVNLLHIFKRPFLRNTSGRLLLLLLRFHRLRHSSSCFLYHLPGKQTWTNSVKYFWNEMPSFSVAIDSMISSVKSCHIFSLFGKCC